MCKRVPKPDADPPPPPPFCSPRCKLVDLGSWLDGRYVVSESAAAADGGDATSSIPERGPRSSGGNE